MSSTSQNNQSPHAFGRLGQDVTSPGVEGQDLSRYFANENCDPLSQAFDGKIAIHPGVSGKIARGEEAQKHLTNLLDTPRKGKSVAYIHIPFCETHCLYCGFYTRGYNAEESHRYTDTLLREMDFWQARPAMQKGPVHAVYLGGGTPTALEAEDLRRLLLGVRERLPLANDCEITVEGRLANFDNQKMEACLEGGANRFSLGVQTFSTEIRQDMGRIGTREEVLGRIQSLLAYDQAAVIIDLIYGFPKQTLSLWLDDIATAQEIGLDGVDLYQLNVYESSPLFRAIQKGTLPSAASRAEQSAYFAAGVKAMQDQHFRRLSITHWGGTARERNLYNLFMKGTAHCLAFGPSAGGNMHGHFYMNINKYTDWSKAVSEGIKPVQMLTFPEPHTYLNRTIAECMEQGFMSLSRLENIYNIPLTKIWKPILSQWERAGLIVLKNSCLELTLAGQYWQVNITQLLLEFLKKNLKKSFDSSYQM